MVRRNTRLSSNVAALLPCIATTTGDDRLDFNPDTLETGYFGINIHASSTRPYEDEKETTRVGNWSEGCQVHATSAGFRAMMDLCHKQIEAHPTWTRFTYTLLDQWW